jgi:hypothetical protein
MSKITVIVFTWGKATEYRLYIVHEENMIWAAETDHDELRLKNNWYMRTIYPVQIVLSTKLRLFFS